ncbi:hypothetical protein [Clostridium luticellarii]|uniref:Mu-like prophage protein Com n=1 Tax=Clostridium luticellarii TaxID=1691940 RepID=A0A2T0BNV7_9CLOT|nr:hypothetical protein [Clostridium luticellarii]PRR85564.1 hypothetical protein CLLU_14850 [Clostridium luticellarii]
MKTWYKCPFCGRKLAIIDNTINISGVFLKCHCCKREIEIKNNIESRNPEARVQETRVQRSEPLADTG